MNFPEIFEVTSSVHGSPYFSGITRSPTVKIGLDDFLRLLAIGSVLGCYRLSQPGQ
jgi:hypothetical protein